MAQTNGDIPSTCDYISKSLWYPVANFDARITEYAYVQTEYVTFYQMLTLKNVGLVD